MNSLPQISVIICSIDAGKFANVTQCYRRVLSGYTHEIIGIHDARSLAEGYNRGIRQSVGEVLIFSHDDVLILDENFGQKILSRLDHFDVLGFSGTERLTGGDWDITDFPYLHGAVAHAPPGNHFLELTIYGTHQWPVADNIKAIDGLCIITKRSVVKTQFFDAQTFDGFHLYDVDFSFSAHHAGYRIGVCCDIPLIHYSGGSFDAKHNYYARRFEEKHAGHLDSKTYLRDKAKKLMSVCFTNPEALTRTWCEGVFRRSTIAMSRRSAPSPHQSTFEELVKPQPITLLAEVKNLPVSEVASGRHNIPEQLPDTSQQVHFPNDRLSSEDLQHLRVRPDPKDLPSLVILIRVPAGTEHLLANTLDSLATLAPTWQLIAIADIAPPEELNEIDCIHWMLPNEVLHDKVIQIEADWILEAPPGTRFDDSLLWALLQVHRSSIYAVFADNDYYDQSGHRHAPRFKPGVNPAALMSGDLAGPLCVVRDNWLKLPPREPSPVPWLTTLWAITHAHGWKAVKHLPNVLFSLPQNARHAPDGVLPALEKELSANAKPAEIQAINADCWSILWRLPLPCPSVEVFIRTDGDTGLIERCISSIAENTKYAMYEVSLLINHQIDTDLDPDLEQWLQTYKKTYPASTIWRQGESEPQHSFINRVATSTKSEFILLLSDELVALHADWLTELVRACQATDVVAASPRLIQPQTGHIESCGYVLGLQGWRGSAHFRQPRIQTPDDFDWIDASRDLTTLTTTCAFIRADSFRLAGGLNELPPLDLGINSSYSLCLADLSLRLHSKGQRLLYVPRANFGGSAEPNPRRRNSLATLARQTVLDKERFEAFQTRWWPIYASDPYWNRNLSLSENRPQIEADYVADWFHLGELNQSQPSPQPKILAHVIDNAQADFRVTDALAHLKQRGRVSTCVWVQRIDRPARLLTASEIIRLAPDVHIVQNYVNDLCLDALNNWRSIPQRPFTVFALDDVISAIDPSSPFYKNFSPDTRSRLAYALARCDRMVVSTDFLADYYRNFIKDIRVVPNRLEMSKWLPLTPKKRPGSKVRIGWAGGTTHQRDLMLLKEVIEQTRGEADWIFFGMCPPEIAPLLAESHPFIPYSDYPNFLANLGLDLAVAPLAETVFNRGKSNLRLLELGILGLPVVCTDIDPYQNSPACRVKNSVPAWVSALRERIHDPDAREKEGRTMRQWVLQNFLLDNHLDEWLDAHTPG